MKNNRWRWAREDDDNASSVSNVSQKSDKNNLPVAMIDLPRMKRQLKEDIKKIVEEKFDELEINIKEHHENLVKEIKTVRQCVSEVYSVSFDLRYLRISTLLYALLYLVINDKGAIQGDDSNV